ncbi:MAG TPA: WYL domain-containing protein [Syntrophobacteraceae bacterium]|nr:WYL domain-containing protein [Syntrophobacteraceae bacterium]
MSRSNVLPGLGRICEETKRVSRILQLIQIITARPDRYHRRDLAARFEISERMIQKDLDVIRHGLKLPLTPSPSGYRFDQLPRLPAVGFDFAEAVSLLLAVEAGRRNTGIGTPDLDTAVERVRGLFPPEFARRMSELGRLGKKYKAEEKPVTGEHRWQMLALLERAIVEARKVRIRYSTSSRGGEESIRIIHPYHLLPFVRSWHLVAHCERRDRVLTFKVDRIRRADPLSDRFEIPHDFSLDDHLGDGWGLMSGRGEQATDVELLFEPEAGRWVSEERWHKSQTVEILTDGAVRFGLHLPITPDFVSWILYYGWRVEVMSPHELRDRVAEEHRRAADRYHISDGTSLSRRIQ